MVSLPRFVALHVCPSHYLSPHSLLTPCPPHCVRIGSWAQIRREFGQDIAGACGQLVVNFEASEKSAAMMDVGADDVEEKGSAGSACGGAGGGSCDDSHAHPAIPVASIAPAPPADIEDFAGPKPPRGEVVPSSRRSVAPAAAPNPLVMPAKSEQVIPAPPPSNTSLSLLEAVSWLLLLIGIAGILVRMLTK